MIKSINITKQNYLDFSDFAVKRVCNPKKNKDSGFLKSMILWFMLTIVSMFVFQITSISFSSFHWQTALITAFPLLLFIFVFLSNIRKFKKLAIPNDNGIMIGNKTFEFQPEGVNVSNHFGNCFYKWEVVEAVEENKGNIYIFVDKLLALIIPSESFSDTTEKEELKQLILKYV